MEEQLEQEEQARQKLQLEKASLEHKYQASQNQMSELEGAKERLLKEKKHADDRLVQLSQKQTQEDERAKQSGKLRSKAHIFLS